MIFRHAFLFLILVVTTRLDAVYAPIPELEQGKALTVYLGGGVYYDSNIFGASANAIDSVVYQFTPSVAFNMSVTPKTFASASYRLSLDHMVDRPGKKTVDSHELMARVAHTFSPQTEMDVSNNYQIGRNPESLQPGLSTVLNGDQSFHRNQFDGRFATSLTRRTGVVVKTRAVHYAYENEGLSRSLDRDEYLAGFVANHALLPELKANAELRFQKIIYTDAGDTKDKQSTFALIGADYAVTSRFAFSVNGGAEHRQRKGDRDRTAPYIEVGAKYDYAKKAFVSIGYGFTLEENSNPELYTDSEVNRFFANVQQGLGSQFTATMSFVWEPSTLLGRTGISPDREETNTKLGAALIYSPAKNWSVSATVDHDKVESDDPSRPLERTRYGVSGRYVF